MDTVLKGQMMRDHSFLGARYGVVTLKDVFWRYKHAQIPNATLFSVCLVGTLERRTHSISGAGRQRARCSMWHSTILENFLLFKLFKGTNSTRKRMVSRPWPSTSFFTSCASS